MSSADILSINMFCTCLSPSPTTYPTTEKSGQTLHTLQRAYRNTSITIMYYKFYHTIHYDNDSLTAKQATLPIEEAATLLVYASCRSNH